MDFISALIKEEFVSTASAYDGEVGFDVVHTRSLNMQSQDLQELLTHIAV